MRGIENLSFLGALLVGGLAADSQFHQSTVYETCGLSNEVCDSLLDCIRQTGTDYRFYVDDDGAIVVIPAGSRSFDYSGVDAGLFQCMESFSDRLRIATEQTVEPPKEHESALPLHDVSCEWLRSKGALGRTEIDATTSALNGSAGHGPSSKRSSTQSSGESELNMRTTLHYYSYKSHYLNCHSHGLDPEYSGECRNELAMV